MIQIQKKKRNFPIKAFGNINDKNINLVELRIDIRSLNGDGMRIQILGFKVSKVYDSINGTKVEFTKNTYFFYKGLVLSDNGFDTTKIDSFADADFDWSIIYRWSCQDSKELQH